MDAASAGEAGLAALWLAREAGAEVYVAASAAQREYVESLGVAAVLDAEAPDLVERVLEATGGSGADVALGGSAEALGPSLGTGGRFVELAGPGGWAKVPPERAEALLEGLAERIAAGEPDLPPTRRCPLSEVESAQRLAHSGRHLGGIALTLDEVGFRPDASYLITGGLGALGLEAAEWLAEQGAGHLVLVGRSEAGAEVRERLAGLEEATGCRMVTARADVADAGEVAGLLERFSGGGADGAEWPPLAGVIHAAGVLDDGVVTGQTAERMAAVLRPKMQGAWQLHRLTRDLDLDLFVLYSSAVATVGLPGQTSYAAANGYLDGLAGLRRSEGLAATSVAWGSWEAGGMAASEAAQAGFARRGVLPLSAEQAHGALAELLASTRANGTVMDTDWRRMGQDPAVSRLPLLAGLLEAAPAARKAGASLAERLRGTPEAEREGALVDFLRTELQAVLQRSSPPEPDVGFFDLGMDSLMAVEFRNRLNEAFGGEYVAPMTVVFDYPDVRGLARHVAGELGLLSAAAKPERREPARDAGGGIAVVGLACRFPGGSDLEGFWDLLAEGRCAVTEGRAAPGGGPRYWGGYVEGIDQFDAEFFRIAPVEARLLDPQQRLMLETSWQALEDAGIAPVLLRGSRTGVFAGITSIDYAELISREQDGTALYVATGNSPSTAIGRVAFTLGLEGPAMAVDTACSSSLVALHQAVASLQRGEADLALARRGQRDPDADFDGVVRERRDAGARRALQDVRRGGGRVRARRGLRDGRAEAAGGRGSGRGPDLGRNPGHGGESGRRQRWADGAERAGAGAGDRGSAGAGRGGAGGGGLSGGTRYRDAAGRSHRSGRGGRGLRAGPRGWPPAADRLGEDEYRPPRGRGGRGGSDQGAAGDEPGGDPEAPALRGAEPAGWTGSDCRCG